MVCPENALLVSSTRGVTLDFAGEDITRFLVGKGSSSGCGRALSSPATSLPFVRCGILLLCTSSLPSWSHSVFKVTCCHWIHFLPAESLTSVPHTFWIQRFISYLFIFNFCESVTLNPFIAAIFSFLTFKKYTLANPLLWSLFFKLYFKTLNYTLLAYLGLILVSVTAYQWFLWHRHWEFWATVENLLIGCYASPWLLIERLRWNAWLGDENSFVIL